MNNSQRLNKVIEMCRKDYRFMIQDLRSIQAMIDDDCRESPDDEPSIDVRLCVDFDHDDPNWIIRYGDSSYDQRHSEMCGADMIGKDTKFSDEADTTLESMIDQCLDQLSQRGDV